MKPIVKVQDLGKLYTLGTTRESYSTIRESIVAAVRRPLGMIRRNGGRADNRFWALRDVNFDIMPGEVVGIIGRNGAGKSTLLKILSRITEPTTGRAEMFGRVGSLLEVGTGFHAELTGRENIFLNGAILGMKRSEIAKKFDEIVDFAEVEAFLDTPVKRYSSGMYMRLAFAVAANLEPEILVVDEVLSVGDAAFQKKCLGKMESVARAGRTVLFVSHNMAAVESLCQKGIFLEKGVVKSISTAKESVEMYLKNVVERSGFEFASVDEAIGDNTIRIKRIRVLPESISVDDPFTIDFEFWNISPFEEIKIGFDLLNSHSVIVFSTLHDVSVEKGKLATARCSIPAALLNDGNYSVNLHFFSSDMRPLFATKDIVSLTINDVERTNNYLGKISGVVRPRLKWDNI